MINVKVQKQNFVEYLSDEAVDFILQEAAEAFAIERTRQSVGYDVPSFEEIARAVSGAYLHCFATSHLYSIFNIITD